MAEKPSVSSKDTTRARPLSSGHGFFGSSSPTSGQKQQKMKMPQGGRSLSAKTSPRVANIHEVGNTSGEASPRFNMASENIRIFRETRQIHSAKVRQGSAQSTSGGLVFDEDSGFDMDRSEYSIESRPQVPMSANAASTNSTPLPKTQRTKSAPQHQYAAPWSSSQRLGVVPIGSTSPPEKQLGDNAGGLAKNKNEEGEDESKDTTTDSKGLLVPPLSMPQPDTSIRLVETTTSGDNEYPSDLPATTGTSSSHHLNIIREEFDYFAPEEEADLLSRLAQSSVADTVYSQDETSLHKAKVADEQKQFEENQMTMTGHGPYSDAERRRMDKFGETRQTFENPNEQKSEYLLTLGRPEDASYMKAVLSAQRETDPNRTSAAFESLQETHNSYDNTFPTLATTVNSGNSNNNNTMSTMNKTNALEFATEVSLSVDPTSKETDNQTKNNGIMDSEDVEGVFVDGMTLPQINKYLQVHGFLHVTPRYNVEKVKSANFYDLVVLEIPGNNVTGLVWKRKFGDTTGATFQLQAHQIIQLSLDGALIMGEKDPQTEERFSELLSLEDLVAEREMSENVRKLPYFKYYREARIFNLLKHYVRAQRMARVVTKMRRDSIFSHVPLIHCMQKVKSMTVTLEEDTELFEFYGQGSHLITTYLDAQINKIKKCTIEISKVIGEIGSYIEEQHLNLTSDEYLEAEIKDVKKYHPFMPAELMGLDISWAELRSIKNVKGRISRKMEKMLYIAQYMVQSALASVLQKFWKRSRLLIRGILSVDHDLFTGQSQGFWNYDDAVKQPPISEEGALAMINKDGAVVFKKEGDGDGDGDEDGNGNKEDDNALLLGTTTDSGIDTDHLILDVTTETVASSLIRSMMFDAFDRSKSIAHDIDKAWEDLGSHVYVDVSLCTDNGEASYQDFLSIPNFNKFKVRVSPSKYAFLDHIHTLCGSLGRLLEDLPNLKLHPMIISNDLVYKEKTGRLAEIEVEDSATPLSLVYFSHLHVNNITASTDGLTHALDFLKVAQGAHQEAANIDSQLSRLQEVFRKLHHINPDSLAQQLQRSLVLNKIRDMSITPDMNDEVMRAVTRDRGRSSGVSSAVDVLDQGRNMAIRFKNIKNYNGFISSFVKVGEQINDICAIKEARLFERLPVVYISRTGNFTRKLNELAKDFELFGTELEDQIELLRKLKSFELTRAAFDLEVEICEGLHTMIKHYESSSRHKVNQGRIRDRHLQHIQQSVSHKGGGRSRKASTAVSSGYVSTYKPMAIPTSSIDKTYQEYDHARDKLASALTRAKGSLMSMMNMVKASILERRRGMHREVGVEQVALLDSEKTIASAAPTPAETPSETPQDSPVSSRPQTPTSSTPNTTPRQRSRKSRKDPNSSMAINKRMSYLDILGSRIGKLREDIDEMIDYQVLMLDAHDYVGSAAPVFLVDEIDYFDDMQALEGGFGDKYLAWSSIKSALLIKRQVIASKLNGVNAKSLNKKLAGLQEAYEYLSGRLDEPDTLSLLQKHLLDLTPILEVVSYLSSDCLRPRHWKWLSDHVFINCGLSLKFGGDSGELVTVLDVQGDDPVGMGFVSRFGVAEIIYRGVDKHLANVRRLTSDAAIESMLEETMNSVESAMQKARVELSMEWLNETRMREKISFDLHQAVNLRQISVLYKYCQKTVLVLMNTSSDMSLKSLNKRLESLLSLVQRMQRLTDDLFEVQNKWIYVFHFVKFSGRGEVDRDTPRLFQVCSEDMKKVEMALQQKQLSLYHVCQSKDISSDMGTDAMKSNLDMIMEDAHSNMQSLLDAYPRFSRLSYNKLGLLVRAWLVGPIAQLELVSDSIHEMFEGVGKVETEFSTSQRRFICVGCTSYDKLERIEFKEPVPFTLSLENFMDRFEAELRGHLARTSDAIILNRVKDLRNMLENQPFSKIMDNCKLMFAQRMAQISAMCNNETTNQALVLANQCAFTEDIWFCLGHAIGCILHVRDDVQDNMTGESFFTKWRTLLLTLLNECKDNVAMLLSLLRTHRTGAFKCTSRKAKALISALFLQETSFARLINYTLTFRTLDSAGEYWAGRYQILFLFDKSERLALSPYDVTIGCVTTPYGLEYHGGLVRVLTDEQVDRALQMATGSASCYRASVFISRDDENPSSSSFEIDGEQSISCRDLADALGRVFTCLSSVQNEHGVKLFLARLVYLDAVGCIDFSALDADSLQYVVTVLNQCWDALRNQQYMVLQEWLKFPMKTKFGKTDVQMNRIKTNVSELRAKILHMMQCNTYIGIIVVGLASETLYADHNVMNQISRSVFNLVSVSHNKPLHDLGLLLALQGFVFGMEIQSIFQQTMNLIQDKYGDKKTLLRKLCCTNTIRHLAAASGRALLVRSATDVDSAKSKGQAKVLNRIQIELECFAAVQWEYTLMIFEEHGVGVARLRQTMFQCLQDRMESLFPPAKGGDKGDKYVPQRGQNTAAHKAARAAMQKDAKLEKIIGSSSLVVPQSTKMAISTHSRQLGYISGFAFQETGAKLWTLMTNRNNCLLILSGEPACGKTAVRNSVLETIRTNGHPQEELHCNGDTLHDLRSTNRVLRAAEKWINITRRHKKLAKEKEEKEAALRVKEEEEAEAVEDKKKARLYALSHPVGVQGGIATPAQSMKAPPSPVKRMKDGAAKYDPNVQDPTGLPMHTGGDIEEDDIAPIGLDEMEVNYEDEEEDSEGHNVYTSVLYHASLTTHQLLGTFDKDNLWSDGLLIRKLRQIVEEWYATKDTSRGKDDRREQNASYVIVLDGPIGFHIEQLFAASHFQISGASTLKNETYNNHLVLPSGELFYLPDNLLIVMETSDMSNASPPLLAHTPFLHMVVPIQSQVHQISRVWILSVRNWLGYFSVWHESLDLMQQVLLDSNFIIDMLSFDEMKLQVVAVSRISCFYRILEELLSQIHIMVLTQGSYTGMDFDDDSESETASNSTNNKASDAKDTDASKSETESESDDDPTAGSIAARLFSRTRSSARDTSNTTNATKHNFNKEHLTLSAKEKDRLMSRVKIAIAYASVWGFGGAVNGSANRKFFDTCSRDNIEKYLGSDPKIADENEMSIFDLVLNLETISMIPAMSNPHNKFGIPKSFDDVGVDCLLRDHSRLHFRTSNTTAVDQIMRLLMCSGGHVLLMGHRGSGKSQMIGDLLSDLRSNSPTPHQVRKNVTNNLMQIVTDKHYSEGIGSTLTKMRKVLKALVAEQPVHDSETDFTQCWHVVQMQLLDLLTRGAKAHCHSKTVFTASTSVRCASTADTLRRYIEREFCTEVDNVFETPRYNHGVVFVDDLHLCDREPSDASERVVVDNRPEAFLKGLMDNTPAFGIRKNTDKGVMTATHYGGRVDGLMSRQMYDMPVIHRPTLTDPRSMLMTPDNYHMQRVGCVAALTGDLSKVCNSHTVSPLLKHYGTISVPTFTSTELHVALIAGASVAMEAGIPGSNMVQVLKPEVIELSKLVINVASKMVGTNDINTTTNLEKAARNTIAFDVAKVHKFCTSLKYGASSVSNKAGLLDLYIHEWQREFLDPLPDGTQRERMINLMRKELEEVDASEWYVSDEWLSRLTNGIGEASQPIWSNVTLFGESREDTSPLQTFRKSMQSSPGNNQQGSGKNASPEPYLPLQMDSDKINSLQQSIYAYDGTTTTTTTTTSENIDKQASKETNVLDTKIIDSINSNTEVISISNSPSKGSMAGSLDESNIDKNDLDRYRDVLIEALPSDLLPHSLLYPTAISMLLRIVRCINPMNSNILLSGYFGTTRLTALHLAARICHLRLYSFDVKESIGVVEVSSSKRAENSTNFRKFLQGALLRAAGFGEVDTSSEESHRSRDKRKNDHKSSSMGSPSTKDGNKESKDREYSVTKPSRTLLVIQGAQQLNYEDRRLLLNFVDYEDPCSLLEDDEIIAICNALRRQSDAQALHMVVDSLDVLNDNHVLEIMLAEKKAKAGDGTPANLMKTQKAFNKTGWNVDNDDGDSSGSEADTDGASVADSDADNSEAGSQQGEQTAAVKSTPKARKKHHHSDRHKFRRGHRVNKDALTGYAFQWVKRRLQETLNGNLFICMDSDMPRALKLATSTPQEINNALSLPPLESARDDRNENKKGNEKGDHHDNNAEGPDAGKKIAKMNLTKMRYSPLTQHLQPLLASRDDVYIAPRFVMEKRKGDDNDDGGVAADFGQQESAGNASVESISPQGLFTCPLLGTVLSRKFRAIWWDIDGVDAVCGITQALIRNEINRYNTTAQDQMRNMLQFNRIYASSPKGLPMFKSQSPLMSSPLGIDSPHMATLPDEEEDDDDEEDNNTNNVITVTGSIGASLGYIATKMIPVGEFHMGEMRGNMGKDGNKDKELKKQIDQQVAGALSQLVNTDMLNDLQMNLFFQTNKDISRVYDFVSCFSASGIFDTLKVTAEDKETLASLQQEDTAAVDFQMMLNSMFMDAQSMLPQLMCLKTASDALFLSEPLLSNGPERQTEVACQIVSRLITTSCRLLLGRKTLLTKVVVCLDEALDVLERHGDFEDELHSQLIEIQSVMTRKTKEVANVVHDIQTVHIYHSMTPGMEYASMLKEEKKSIEYETDLNLLTSSSRWDNILRKLNRQETIEWESLAAIYVTGATEELIAMMRALMCAVDYAPHRFLQGKSEGVLEREEMTDVEVSRHGCLLLRSNDMRKRMSQVKVTETVTKAQVDELKAWNMKMQVMSFDNGKNGDPSLKSSIPALAKAFMVALVNYYESHVFAKKSKVKIAFIEETLESIRDGNQKVLDDRLSFLNMEKEKLDQQLYLTNHQTLDIRSKQDAMHLLMKNEKVMKMALLSMKSNYQGDVDKISDIFRFLVPDACVATAVLVRAGWLSEQVRQEVADQFRTHITKHFPAKKVSSTPFIMGILLDRLQLREWTAFRPGSVPREPSSINCLHLVNLSPMYTYIVDPEGTAEVVLRENPPKGYDLCCVSALRFSLHQLEVWANMARESSGDAAALSIIVTDVQAGVSDDLISFLSAEVYTVEKEKEREKENMKEGKKQKGKRDRKEKEKEREREREGSVSPSFGGNVRAAGSRPNSKSSSRSPSPLLQEIPAKIDVGPESPLAMADPLLLNPVDAPFKVLKVTKLSPALHSWQDTCADYELLIDMNPSYRYSAEDGSVTSYDKAGDDIMGMGEGMSPPGPLTSDSVAKMGGPSFSKTFSRASLATLGSNAGSHTGVQEDNADAMRPLRLCRIRVHLLSTRAPTLDSMGISRPFPVSCMKNMLVVQWGLVTARNCSVEAKPMMETQSKTYTVDSSLKHNMTTILLDEISCDHARHLEVTEEGILKVMHFLSEIENKTTVNLIAWMVNERPISFRSFRIPGIIQQAAIPIGFIHNISKFFLVIEAAVRRHHLALELEVLLSSERDLLTYRQAVGEVFNMSLDFLKTCGAYLPTGVLPPHTLTSHFLCAKGLTSAIDEGAHHGLFEGIVESMFASGNVYKSIVILQRRWRDYKYGTNTSPVLSRRVDRKRIDGNSKDNKRDLSPSSLLLSSPINRSSDNYDGGVETIIEGTHEDTANDAITVEPDNDDNEPEIKLYSYKDVHFFENVSVLHKYSTMLHKAQAGPTPMGNTDSRMSMKSSDMKYPFPTHCICGISPHHRSNAATIIYHSTRALRSFFLKHMVKYVKENIRPGLEWLVKFLLVQSAYMQGEGKMSHLPEDEIRALHYFIQNSVGNTIPRYSYYVGFKRDLDVPVVNMKGRTSTAVPKVGNKEVSMGRRKANRRIFDCRGQGNLDGVSVHRSSPRWRTKLSALVDNELKRQRHTNLSSEHMYYSKYMDTDGIYDIREDCVYLDTPACDIVNKSDLFLPQERKGDTFEVYWLQALGVSLYSTDNTKAAIALGATTASLAKASKNVVKNMTARRTTMGSGGGSGWAAGRGTMLIGQARGATIKGKGGRNTALQSPGSAGTRTPKSGSLRTSQPFTNSLGLHNPLSLAALLNTDESRLRFYLLSNNGNTTLSNIFKGTAQGVNERIQDFVAWKAHIQELGRLDMHRLEEDSMLNHLENITPPIFESMEDDDDTSDEGLWLRGYELSILQTMLLSEAISPGSCGSVANFAFVLLTHYLEMGGRIVQHLDEDKGVDDFSKPGKVSGEGSLAEGNEEEEEDDDEEGSEEDVPMVGGIISISALTAKSNTKKKGNADDDDGDDRVIAKQQDNVGIWNSWTKLGKVLDGTSDSRGPIPRDANSNDINIKNGRKEKSYKLSARYYNNWEEVLLEVLNEDESAKKYVFKSNLDAAIMDEGSCAFLCADVSQSQMRNLSQRMRDLNKEHDKDLLPIVTCATSVERQGEGQNGNLSLRKAQRQHLFQLHNRIRNMSAGSTSNDKLFLEGLNLTSPMGNSIILSNAGTGFGVGLGQYIQTQNVSKLAQYADIQLQPSNKAIPGLDSNNSKLIPTRTFDRRIASTTNSPSIAAASTPFHFSTRASKRFSVAVGGGESNRRMSAMRFTRASISVPGGPGGGMGGPTSPGGGDMSAEAKKTMKRKMDLASQVGVSSNDNKLQKQEVSSLVLSSTWGQVTLGQAPSLMIAAFNFSWLPRYFVADIISNQNLQYSHAFVSRVAGLPPSGVESLGILQEELESSFNWILVGSGVLSKSSIAPIVKERLKNARRVELRAAACVLTIWRLVNCLRSSLRQSVSLPPLWSEAGNHLTLWQLLRILVKTSEIMCQQWTMPSKRANRRNESMYKPSIPKAPMGSSPHPVMSSPQGVMNRKSQRKSFKSDSASPPSASNRSSFASSLASSSYNDDMDDIDEDDDRPSSLAIQEDSAGASLTQERLLSNKDFSAAIIACVETLGYGINFSMKEIYHSGGLESLDDLEQGAGMPQSPTGRRGSSFGGMRRASNVGVGRRKSSVSGAAAFGRRGSTLNTSARRGSVSAGRRGSVSPGRRGSSVGMPPMEHRRSIVDAVMNETISFKDTEERKTRRRGNPRRSHVNRQDSNNAEEVYNANNTNNDEDRDEDEDEYDVEKMIPKAKSMVTMLTTRQHTLLQKEREVEMSLKESPEEASEDIISEMGSGSERREVSFGDESNKYKKGSRNLITTSPSKSKKDATALGLVDKSSVINLAKYRRTQNKNADKTDEIVGHLLEVLGSIDRFGYKEEGQEFTENELNLRLGDDAKAVLNGNMTDSSNNDKAAAFGAANQTAQQKSKKTNPNRTETIVKIFERRNTAFKSVAKRGDDMAMVGNIDDDVDTKFIGNSLRAFVGLFFAELSPQMQFLKKEDKERMISFVDNHSSKETVESNVEGATHRPSFANDGGVGDALHHIHDDEGSDSQYSKVMDTFGYNGASSRLHRMSSNLRVPQFRRYSGRNSSINFAAQEHLAAHTPGLTNLSAGAGQFQGHSLKDGKQDNRAFSYEEEEYMRSHQNSKLPEIKPDHLDFKMDGLTSADIILYMVKWCLASDVSDETE